MVGKVNRKNLDSRTARSRHKRGRQPHWEVLQGVEGRVHIGWQCWKGDPAGRWLLRRYVGNRRYRIETLGLADDSGAVADGERTLSYEQAVAKAHAIVGKPQEESGPFTVRAAWEHYLAYKRKRGEPVDDLVSRGPAHILPELGDLVVAKLKTETLDNWLTSMAKAPAQSRPKAGKPQYKAAASSEDAIRARRASANRVLTMLKAALNRAWRDGKISSDAVWRRVEPFEAVDAARLRYLTMAEGTRLLNACDAESRPLVQAALETGCRYSELACLEVADFNPDARTIAIRKSKSGKIRHVILTPEGAAFFQQHCAGRSGTELMFRHADGRAWQKSEQGRPMRAACGHARITPAISFHILRHTWASHAVMNGVPLLVVAKNLGHGDTRMVEKHYGHLAEDYVTKAIHANAPRFGTAASSSVVPIERALSRS